MIRYVLTRLMFSVLVMFVVSLATFFMLELAPGDACTALLGVQATPETRARCEEHLGFSEWIDADGDGEWSVVESHSVNLFKRYGDWVMAFVQGDWGNTLSLQFQRQSSSISDLVKAKLPPTLELGIISLTLVVVLAIPIGIYSALRPGSRSDTLASSALIAGNSIPEFLLAISLIIVFGVTLKWLPVSGYVAFLEDPVQNLRHMAMPAIAIAATQTTLLMRSTRSAMINVINDEYIRTARAKGLTERVVIFRHALRNALIPVITVFSFQIGIIVGGAVVTEQVFAIPGIGRWLVEATIQRPDFRIVQVMVTLFAFVTVVIYLLVDISYMIIDPRIRAGLERP